METGGDGVYLDQSAGLHKGETWPTLRYNCENVIIRDILCLRNYRQGMSVIGAVNLTVTGSTFADTAGTPPAAGVDLEPDSVHQQLTGIRFSNCTFRNNSGVAVDIFLLAFQNYTGAAVDIAFERWHIIGGDTSTHGGFRLAGVVQSGPSGLVRVSDTTIEDTFDSGILIEAKQYDRVAARFERCLLRRVATGRAGMPGWDPVLVAMAPIWIEKLSKFRQFTNMTVGGVELDNVTVVDDRERPFLRAGVNESIDVGVREITGSVTLTSKFAKGCRPDFGAEATDAAVRCVLASIE